MSAVPDNRKVVLLKSLRTSNRFYTLVPPDSPYRNADTIEEFPEGLTLGIAYPCLEDGLNDFAVIRTTFETIDLFPDDEELRSEMMGIINDARENLRRRLIELRDRVANGQAHFLGTDLAEFQESVVHLVERGAIRRTLDNMMKVDVFESVTQCEAETSGKNPDPMYRYAFVREYDTPETYALVPREFVARLFDDVLVAVNDEDNYRSKYYFDCHVFQKFIALMFVNYATTDRMFHGTSREDYGVSGEREMNQTPLYQAVAVALRQLERGEEPSRPVEPPYRSPEPAVPGATAEEDLAAIFSVLPDLSTLPGGLEESRTVELPAFGTEQMLTEPFIALADALKLLSTVDHPRIGECRTLVSRAGHQLFERLKQLGILSPIVQNPFPGQDGDRGA
jgi:hypothetical protein